MTKVYWRCNSGHYFCAACCPFDGWGSPELNELYQAAEMMAAMLAKPSLVGLQAAGVSEAALRRVIVVDFGSETAAFDAVSPDRYIVAGKEILLEKAGPELR